jgi:alanine-glyoxylate transaminase/serine-glyoxylate transaminase/serine-pyruvate transaminase
VSDLRLMIPGPVEADEDILAALSEQTLPHYGAAWMPIFNTTTDYLKRLFETDSSVLLMPGAGSGALDAGLGSLVPAGAGICIPLNGFFGGRLADMAECYGIHPYKIAFPMGKHIDPDAVRTQLKTLLPKAEAEGHPIQALVVVHHETSTGVLNPLKEIAEAASEFGLPVIVDAVASFGGVRIPFDEWGIDYCVGVPNKCLGVPPGVALVAVSPRAWELAEANPGKHGWYYDLRTWRWYMENWGDWHPTPVTLPTNNIVALLKALRDIFENEGVAAHFASFARAAERVRSGMAGFGFSLLPEPAYAAPMVTALNAPPGLDISGMLDYLKDEHGLLISGGLADLRGKIIRVGHMGRAREPEYVDALLAGVRAYMGT